MFLLCNIPNCIVHYDGLFYWDIQVSYGVSKMEKNGLLFIVIYTVKERFHHF